MQRWFFLESSALHKLRRKQPKTKKTKTKMSKKVDEEMGYEDAVIVDVKFCVSVEKLVLAPREKVCIIGNLPELGSWDPERVIPLIPVSGTDTWCITLSLHSDDIIEYRYCICAITDEPKHIWLHQWEGNIHPRKITSSVGETMDTYNEYNNVKAKAMNRFLVNETMIQFKLFREPLHLKSRLCNRPIFIKFTPVRLSFNNTELPCIDDTSASADAETVLDVPGGSYVEVCTLNNENCKMVPQEQFGRIFNVGDNLIFNILIPDPETVAYLVDFFCHSSKAADEDPPSHIGYTYILPTAMKNSEGKLELPVTCNIKHRPIGSLNVEYLVVKPCDNKLSNLRETYAKHWDPNWTGLDVGHRGLGSSFKTKEGNSIRENTIASLKQAALSGADMLEFDVQLSKDMIPVIYHDFYVCISMKRKKQVDFNEMLELPVKDLSLEQLQKLKVYHLVEGRNHESRFDDEDLDEHQPFPTLAQILDTIDPKVGFNVELKWTMELNDGTFELNNPFDMNTYVDKVLEVVLQHAGERKIVFSCFNPDICTMVRYKQSKYPVMFLTQGQTSRYPSYRDVRCLTIAAAVQSAVSSDILGIVVHTEDLLRDPTQIKLATDADLVIFCWGDDNNDKGTIAKMKSMGLHAVIYDKLDQYTDKTVKESVFLVEARDSEKELIRLSAQQPSTTFTVSSSSESESVEKPFLDLNVRDYLANQSTATSLESVSSNYAKEKLLKRNRKPIVDKELKTLSPVSFSGMFSNSSVKSEMSIVSGNNISPKKQRIGDMERAGDIN